MIPYDPRPDVDNNKKQIFEDHQELVQRIKKTLYYGNGNTPFLQRPSVAMTDVAVELFATAGLRDTLDQLSIDNAANLARPGKICPNSFVLALLYLDRLKNSDADFLERTSPAKLFLVSMMVAHKFLVDEDDESFSGNLRWANISELDLQEVNELEVEFLQALDWSLLANPSEFEAKLRWVEARAAWGQAALRKRSAEGGFGGGFGGGVGFTYADLDVLWPTVDWSACWDVMFDNFAKVFMVCSVSHMATLMTLMGFTVLASQFSQMCNPESLLGGNGATGTPSALDDHLTLNATGNCSSGAIPAQMLTTSLLLATLGCVESDEINEEEMTRKVTLTIGGARFGSSSSDVWKSQGYEAKTWDSDGPGHMPNVNGLDSVDDSCYEYRPFECYGRFLNCSTFPIRFVGGFEGSGNTWGKVGWSPAYLDV